MTDEEALIWFKDDLKNGKCSDECPQCNAMERAIEALEKQIPKKITHEATLQRCATCPNCKNVLDEFIEFIPGQPKIRVTFTHCHFCGQALDWSDNNA